METQKFGARLRELRIQAGLTQRELAERVKVNFSYLSKIESGAMPPPSQKAISKLAEALNADQDELLILAGKVPSDIAQILKNGKTLQRLRSAQIKQMARASGKRGGVTYKIGQTMKQLPSFKGIAKVAIPLVLVLAVATSLWFAAPVRALEISFPSFPSSGTLGSSFTFSAKITIETNDLIPIQSVDLYIYKSDNRTTYEATCADLPTGTTVTPYTTITATGTSGTCGTVSITAVATAGWIAGYQYGTGYAYWKGSGYSFSTGYGYGYGSGPTSITYDVTWTSPSSWPAATYKVDVELTANSTTFTETSSEFTLSSARDGAPAPKVSPGVTDVSDYVDEDGVFTEDVTAESEDGKVELSIDDGTTGLIDGEPLSEISITEMDEPPTLPEYTVRVGLFYDFGPDGATFEPSAILTFTYNDDDIPEGANEEDLVIIYWNGAQWVELEGPYTRDLVNNTISVPVSHFTTFVVVSYTGPAAFTASDLAITPAEVGTGETVTISALVANTGDLAGSYEVTLKINNVVVDVRDITVAGGASQKVTFTTTEDVVGTYAVNVDGLTGTFTVKAPPPPAPPAPVPPAPAPPVVPPVVPPIVPPAPINWWLVGGIIAAVVVIALVIILVVRRQRA